MGSLAALVLAMSVAQVFEPYFRLSLSRSLSRSLSALLSGVFTGSLEEIFFRGILFKGLLQNGRLSRAFVLSSLFYSALHFVKPGEPYFVDGFDPLAGFRHLILHLHAVFRTVKYSSRNVRSVSARNSFELRFFAHRKFISIDRPACGVDFWLAVDAGFWRLQAR